MQKKAAQRSGAIRKFADEIQHLWSKCQSGDPHNIVKAIVTTERNQPAIILHDDQAIQQLTKFCTAHQKYPSCLGIDRV